MGVILSKEIHKLVAEEYQKHVTRGDTPAVADQKTADNCRLILLGMVSIALHKIRHEKPS